MSGKHVQRAVQNYCLYQGALVRRVNSGGRKTEYTTKAGQRRHSWVWFAKWQTLGRDEETAGITDLEILWPGGVWLVAEIKTPGEKLREKQREYRDEVLARDGEWLRVESIDDVREWQRKKGIEIR